MENVESIESNFNDKWWQVVYEQQNYWQKSKIFYAHANDVNKPFHRANDLLIIVIKFILKNDFAYMF